MGTAIASSCVGWYIAQMFQPYLRHTLWLIAAMFTACKCGDQAVPSTEAKRDRQHQQENAPAGNDSADHKQADYSQGLLISLSQYEVDQAGKATANPKSARVDLTYFREGQWQTVTFEDADSNVFHKALAYPNAERPEGIITLGGMEAAVKLWRPEGALSNLKWESKVWWKKDFGGKFNRMRDAEIGNLYTADRPALAVATHDQGVVATIEPGADGTASVKEFEASKDTFVHEIELGDLDQDGALEIYATPSEPNRVDGAEQSGQVLRYTPGQKKAHVVAELGDRHAKEILVDDVDGDGTDELYVSVEGVAGKGGADLAEPVEIRRYDATTPPDKGVVVATLPDRQCRFLTAGDLDGDGKKEMAAAAFRSGLYLLRPPADGKGAWKRELLEKDSSGFEHAALFADLNGDRRDELYVASDDQGELRQFRWEGRRVTRAVILRRKPAGAFMTWNLSPISMSLFARKASPQDAD